MPNPAELKRVLPTRWRNSSCDICKRNATRVQVFPVLEDRTQIVVECDDLCAGQTGRLRFGVLVRLEIPAQWLRMAGTERNGGCRVNQVLAGGSYVSERTN